MRDQRAEEVRSAYRDRYQAGANDEWQAAYVLAVQKAQSASQAEFASEPFQRWLWEHDAVSSIGPGSSVVVNGAYTDVEIIEALWSLRNWSSTDDVLSQARALDAEFDRVLGLVSPRHNQRRPIARLARIFAVLRPHELLCLVDAGRTRHFRQWLEQPSYRLGFIGQHVILRQALREVLGTEKDLEEEVRYSKFSWFVWENILAPDDPEAVVGEAEVKGRATATPRLPILPARIQRKGMFYVSDNLNLLLSMVRAAENGIGREDLMQQIGEEAPGLNRGSRMNLLAQAPALSLLTFEHGVYRPTAAGRALLEGEPAADLLTPVFVRTVFGFAHILDDLARNGAMTREDIAEACRSYYPRWTTNFAPNALVSWMRELDLVAIDGAGAQGKVTLTDGGEYWRSGLPDALKSPAFLLSDELPDEPSPPEEAQQVVPKGILTPPSFEAVVKRFKENPDLSSLVFSDAQIGLIHGALHSTSGKRFLLLAGLSGTGKTSMARGYAQAYCEALGLSVDAHYTQVAVWPDWTDPTGLLGFVNPLTTPPTFQETEALRLLLTAAHNPDKPYFLCLDEMNLARVEHYFAPFLSAMEGRGGRLSIHASRDPVDAIPPTVPWPENLFIIGTVNMDETTYPFSDKVLDRAFTFEFWDVDLAAWREHAKTRASVAILDRVHPVLEAFSLALKPARRHFGYRTCDEVLGFCNAVAGLELSASLDAAILAKVLPKVRGDSGGTLPKAIDDAIEVSDRFELPMTGAKLRQMQSTLRELGAVRFWS
jgi:5-methylcytosine-specific restriction protein B